jgi:NAD-dependent SIR2 family protein deacetylase
MFGNHLSADIVTCSECGQRVEFSRCRVLSKTAGRWRCPACNVTVSQLRRTFKTWPSESFSNLSEE